MSSSALNQGVKVTDKAAKKVNDDEPQIIDMGKICAKYSTSDEPVFFRLFQYDDPDGDGQLWLEWVHSDGKPRRCAFKAEYYPNVDWEKSQVNEKAQENIDAILALERL